MSWDMIRRRQTVNINRSGQSLAGSRGSLETGATRERSDTESSGPITEEKVKMIEDGRAFFCSELVIHAFKLCGISAPTSEASSNWLPADLSEEK